MPDVLRAIPDLNLIITGEFWKDTLPQTQERIAALGIGDNIRLVSNYVADEEVPLYFRAVDALVLPYRTGSGTGPSKIALATDLPLIATTAGDLEDLFQMAPVGVQCPPDDPVALTRAILRFYENPGRYVPAVQAAARALTWDALARQLLSL